MRKLLITLLVVIGAVTYGQEQLNLVSYQKLIADTVSHSTKDTISLTGWSYCKFILTADSSLTYSLNNTSKTDSSYINVGEVLNYPQDAWIDCSIYTKLIIWKTGTATGTSNFRLSIFGRKKP